MGALKYGKYFAASFVLFIVINLPLLINSSFISDDYSVIYLAEKNPFPVLTYYESGLEGLIKNFKPEAFKYRPLTSFSLFINEKVTGLNSIGFHIVNILIHFTTFVLLTSIIIILLKLTNKEKGSYLIFLPLLYLISPVSANEISWIATRSDLLLVLFGISSLYFCLRSIQDDRNISMFISLLFFILALISKENGIFIPFLEVIILMQLNLVYKLSKQIGRKLTFLFLFKLGIVILYFGFRQYLSSNLDLSPMKIISIGELFAVALKTLLFVIIPLDSGSLAYMPWLISAVIVLLSLSSLIIFTICCLKYKKKLMLHIILLVSICLVSTSVFILLGGISHRLLILTIAFSIPSVCLALTDLNTYKHFIPKVNLSFLIFYVLFYLSGYLYISDKWITNMKTEKECINSLDAEFNSNASYIALSYPHALGQTYCFSDIGLAMYYRKNHAIGKYENIYQGAAVNSFSINKYQAENAFNKYEQNSFELVSGFNDIYFTPGAYFTENTVKDQIFDMKNGIQMTVKEINSKNKPSDVKLFNNSEPLNPIYLIFKNSKFERIY